MKIYKFIVKGLVQGVCYRKTIYDNAIVHNIQGEVKNLTNGDVQVIARLDSSNFDMFVSILKKGSTLSKVKLVTSSKIDTKPYINFSITY